MVGRFLAVGMLLILPTASQAAKEDPTHACTVAQLKLQAMRAPLVEKKVGGRVSILPESSDWSHQVLWQKSKYIHQEMIKRDHRRNKKSVHQQAADLAKRKAPAYTLRFHPDFVLKIDPEEEEALALYRGVVVAFAGFHSMQKTKDYLKVSARKIFGAYEKFQVAQTPVEFGNANDVDFMTAAIWENSFGRHGEDFKSKDAAHYLRQAREALERPSTETLDLFTLEGSDRFLFTRIDLAKSTLIRGVYDGSISPRFGLTTFFQLKSTSDMLTLMNAALRTPDSSTE